MVPFNVGSDWIFQRNQYHSTSFKKYQALSCVTIPVNANVPLSIEAAPSKFEPTINTLNALFDEVDDK